MIPLPKAIRADIMRFINTNPSSGEKYSLSQSTLDWLNGTIGIKPNYPLNLYRGLFFTGKNLDEAYSKAMRFTQGHGVHTKLSMSTDRLTSWTSLRGVATDFALNAGKLSFATMKKSFLDQGNGVGVVIESTFFPNQILCSMQRLWRRYNIFGKYGNEYEYIVKPQRNIMFEVKSIYTPQNIKNRTSM